MKFIKIYRRLLKKELENLTAHLSILKKEIVELQQKITSVVQEIEEKKNFIPHDSLEMELKDRYTKHLSIILQNLNGKLQRLLKEEEQLKEEISYIKSKLKLLEKTEKTIKIKAEKREDLLLERFINEVLGHRNRSNS
jgi:prefoldin subunit 5